MKPKKTEKRKGGDLDDFSMEGLYSWKEGLTCCRDQGNEKKKEELSVGKQSGPQFGDVQKRTKGAQKKK